MNLGTAYDVSEIDFYFLAEKLTQGSLYAYYRDSNPKGGAHLIVITGVDIKNKPVYTNNPWGRAGIQTYSEFLNRFVGVKDYPLGAIYETTK